MLRFRFKLCGVQKKLKNPDVDQETLTFHFRAKMSRHCLYNFQADTLERNTTRTY